MTDITYSGYNWQSLYYSGGYPYTYCYSYYYMAYYPSWYASSGSQARLSYNTPFDLSAVGRDNIQLSFYFSHWTSYAYDGNVAIQVSTDGYTWNTIDTVYRYDGTSGWYLHTTDLSAYADSTIYIGFLATSDWWGDMFLDDVAIKAPATSAPPVVEYDQFAPFSIASGETIQVTFPEWTPAAYHVEENVNYNYDLYAAAPLAGDPSPSNNIKTKVINLFYPYLHDIQVDGIITPVADGVAKTYPVQLQISNQGQFPERNFFVGCVIGLLLGNFIDEDFSNGVPPAGWGANIGNWQSSQSNYAGGVAPEATFNWYPSAYGTWRMWTNAIDTTGQTNLALSFKEYVNDYNGGYSLGVETSTDGGYTWQNVWYQPGGPCPATEITINLGAAQGIGSANFQAAWVFYGDSFNINYWFIDDAKMQAPQVINEYDESAAVASWLHPGDTLVLNYPDWTPLNLNVGQVSGTFDYMAVGTQGFADSNPSNDIAMAGFKLTYTHDVTVKKITSPAQGRDDVYLHFDDGTNYNSIGLTSGGTFEAGIRLTPTELADYAGDTIDLIHAHYAMEKTFGGMASGKIKIYDAGTSTAPGDLLMEQAFTPPTTPSWFDVALDAPVAIDGAKDMWIMIEWTHGAGEYPAGCDAGPAVDGKGDWLGLSGTWVEAQIYGLDYNWNLWGRVHEGGGGGGGAPQVSVYVKLGATKDISAVVNNPGTFVESGMTCDATMLYWVDPEGNGTQVYQDSVADITLAPLGGEQALTYDPFTFSELGVYGLYVTIPLGTDDKPSNNQKIIGIGSDGTAPVSTHSVSPITPNGNNGWYVSDPTITLTATDDMSGVGSIMYSIDGATPVPYSAPFKITTNGNHTITFYAVDKVGNQETPSHSFVIGLDKDQPNIILNKEVLINKIRYTAVVSDNTSQIEKVEFWIGPYLQYTAVAPGPYQWVLTPIPHANMTITAKVFDKAGNTNSADQGSVTFDLPAQSQQASHQTTIRV